MGGSVYEPITRQNQRENKLPTKFLVFSTSLFDMRYKKIHFLYILGIEAEAGISGEGTFNRPHASEASGLIITYET